MSHPLSLRLAALSIALATAAASASAALLPGALFTPLASPGQSVPGTYGSETFTAFGLTPALNQGTVAFFGEGQYRTGFYSVPASGGAITPIVDSSNASAPAGYPFFYTFRTSDNYSSNPSLDNGLLAFTAQPYGGPTGLFTATDIHHVNTLSQSGHYGGSVISAGQVYYVGGPSANTALFRVDPSSKAVTTLYSTSTPVPSGSGTFSDLNGNNGPDFNASAGHVAFAAHSSSGEGVYSDLSGSLAKIAVQGDPLPTDSSWHQYYFNSPTLDSSTGALAYATTATFYSQGAAVVELLNGLPTVVAKTADIFGSGGGTSIGGISLDSGHIAFAPRDAGDFRILTDISGSLQQLIATGDSLDGRTISALYLGNQALQGHNLAFTAEFPDGSRAEYLATLPEPSSLSLLAAPLLLLPRRRRA